MVSMKYNRRILVTGGVGFIGSNVVKILAEDENIQVFATFSPWGTKPVQPWSDNVKYFQVDLRDLSQVKALSKHKFDVIIHLASKVRAVNSYQDQDATLLSDNLLIHSNLFKATAGSGVKRIVYLSTFDLFRNLKIKKFTEGEIDKIAIPKEAYEFSKLVGEALAKSYQKQFGIEYVILRLMEYTYGRYFPKSPAGKTPQVVGLIKQILDGDKVIQVKGDPDRSRFWTHFEDLAKAIKLASLKSNAANQEFYIGTGKRMSIASMAKLTHNIVYPNRKFDLKFEVIPDFKLVSYQADYSKAEQILGWTPKRDIQDSLPEIIDWVRSHLM